MSKFNFERVVFAFAISVALSACTPDKPSEQQHPKEHVPAEEEAVKPVQ